MIKMSFKTIGFILAFWACAFIGTSSFANNAKTVYWNEQVIYAAEAEGTEQTVETGRSLNNEEYRNKLLPAIGQMVKQKLEYLEKNGNLPFKVAYFADRTNFNAKGIAQSEGSVKLMIPVIVGDSYHRDNATYKGQTYYKYDVKTLIDLMFCEIGSDGNVHIIHNVPMMAYGTPGSNFELTAPVEEKVLAKQFFLNAKEAIVSDLDFVPEFAKYLGEKHTGNFANIYQVTDVQVCDHVWDGKQYPFSQFKEQKAIKKSIADSFTSKFAKANRKYLVMPSPLSGNEWQNKLVEYIHSFEGCSDANLDFSEQNQNKILLDVYTWRVGKVDRGKFYDGHYDIYNVVIGINGNVVSKDKDGNIVTKALKLKGEYKDEYKIGQNTPIRMTLNWNELFALAANNAIKGK